MSKSELSWFWAVLTVRTTINCNNRLLVSCRSNHAAPRIINKTIFHSDTGPRNLSSKAIQVYLHWCWWNANFWNSVTYIAMPLRMAKSRAAILILQQIVFKWTAGSALLTQRIDRQKSMFLWAITEPTKTLETWRHNLVTHLEIAKVK